MTGSPSLMLDYHIYIAENIEIMSKLFYQKMRAQINSISGATRTPNQLIRSPLDFRLYRIYEGVFIYDYHLWGLNMSILSTFSIISTQVAPRLHQGSSGKAAHIIKTTSQNSIFLSGIIDAMFFHQRD
jgi:hypothetical protein